MLADSIGAVTDSNYYTAFGEDLYSSGSTPHDFKYVGEQKDPNSGFYYNRARWMDPSVGRFTSVDPEIGCLECPLSLHRYLYAEDSPVWKSDPEGRLAIPTIGNLSVGMATQGVLVSQNAVNLTLAIGIAGAVLGAKDKNSPDNWMRLQLQRGIGKGNTILGLGIDMGNRKRSVMLWKFNEKLMEFFYEAISKSMFPLQHEAEFLSTVIETGIWAKRIRDENMGIGIYNSTKTTVHQECFPLKGRSTRECLEDRKSYRIDTENQGRNLAR